MSGTAREIVERLLRAGREVDIDTFVGLMAPEGYLEWPYRPPGVPARVEGRTAIRRHLTEAAEAFITIDDHRNVVIHESLDPEVVIVEYDAHGRVVRTGAPFEQTVIAVFRVRDGQVLSCRDYLNPLPLLEALAGAQGART
ncbi:nuclear transport factor 2 family protein [Actinoplanes friuliensis]|uniref:Phenazine biosynthesis protein phzB 2 n=1 Tax=Actinoplanes friuliensis DSM 7358 TaxID=1246995 RepID=U5W9U7_9ACTN|nr:nuclear transport factor 2 family protein [Actinoplanes friuliensis]AGZ44691.1 Phenazine biosynthesis protein phzB 2 [Actinoplanes friuliensis DSM 7358]